MAPKYDDDPDGESRQLDAEAAHDRAVNAGRTPIYCGHGNQFLIAQELDRHEAKPYGPNPTPRYPRLPFNSPRICLDPDQPCGCTDDPDAIVDRVDRVHIA